MADAKSPANRPLSPHLQIYTPMLTMMMSIVHRITGGALYLGALGLAWWLIAAASGPAYFDFVQGVFGSWLGQLAMIFYSWAAIHHLFGGIRHFIWDTGKGFELGTVELMARLSLAGSLGLTALLWGYLFFFCGGA